MLSCKESSRFLSDGMERDLGFGERLSLRFHTMMCRACTRVEAQLLVMRRGLAEYPVADDSRNDHDPTAR